MTRGCATGLAASRLDRDMGAMGLLLQRTAIVALMAMLASCAHATAGTDVPLVRCHRGPSLNNCLAQSLLRVVDKMSHGDSASRVPKLDPLLVPVMPVSKHGGSALNLNLTFYNMLISDITHHVAVHSVKFDFDNLEIDIRFSRPQVNFKGTYKVSGKLLWMPVWGSGPFQMHMRDVYEHFHIKGVRRMGIDGRTYFHIKDYTSTLEPRSMSLTFDNLFNGNWLLGNGANKLINAQWEAIYNDIAPLSNAHFSSIMRSRWEDVLSREPLDDMFPPPVTPSRGLGGPGPRQAFAYVQGPNTEEGPKEYLLREGPVEISRLQTLVSPWLVTPITRIFYIVAY